jgi:pyruvate formate lyase activating enzyme
MGFGVGLHTGGFNPGLLRQLLPLLDWIGLDIKAPRHAYARITGVPRSGEAAWESLDLTLGSSVPYEVRTTYHPDLLTESDLRTLARELAGSDARN